MKDLTWTCLELTENVRYCNDRPACVEGAAHVTWTAKESE